MKPTWRAQSTPAAHIAWALSACLALSACGSPPVGRDGGADDASMVDEAGGSSAQVAVRLSADVESLEPEVMLERLVVGVVQVRAPNDRGVLTRDVGEALEISGEPRELMLEGATPAVYGSVQLELGSGAWGSALALRLRDGEDTIEVILDEPITVEARCGMPVALIAGGQLWLTTTLDLGALVEVLRESSLPDPVDRVIRIDATTAPALVTSLAARLREAQLDCEDPDAS